MTDARDDLTTLANRFGSDKGDLHYGRHRYTEIYDRLLGHLRDEPIVLAEIGLLHPFDSRVGVAPSLQMWRAYFPKARLIGFDINAFPDHGIEGATVLQGNMRDSADLAALRGHGPFDIIVEDASHVSYDQQFAFGVLFEALRPGGIYVIEDLHWQPPPSPADPTAEQTRAILRRFMVTGRLDSEAIPASRRSAIERQIGRIEMFDSHDAYNADRTDAIAFIHRACAP